MRRALILAALAALPLAASGAARPRIAVLDIRGVQGVSAGTATILTAIVVDDASRAGFDVISQADVSAMIGFEKQKQMLGCSDDSSCLAEIGGALGVDYMLSGQVGQIGSRLHLSFQLLDARKAKVVARAARFSDRDEDALASAAQATVAELLAGRSGDARQASQTQATRKQTETATSGGTGPAKQTAAMPDLSVRAPPAAVPAGPGGPSWFSSRRNVAWLTIGGGAALLAGGLVFGLQAASKRSELEKQWANPDYASIYDRKSGEVKSAALVADVLYVAGSATTGLGIWMLLRAPHPVAVAPAVGDGQVGLVAAGRF
jgi:TolB-like protein